MHLQGENTKFVNENFRIILKIDAYETIINIEYCPPEQDKIIREANAIYERLLREAAEDEAKKQAEIDAVKQSMASNSKTTS